MAKLNLIIENISHPGNTRKVNEDFAGSAEGLFGKLFIVCDGMGGHNGGFTAAYIAFDIISQHFLSLRYDYNPIEELENAFKLANSEILLQSKSDRNLRGMGTTAAVILIKNYNVYYAHIGDSRTYLIRDKQIQILTKDHSLVQELIDSKTITPEEAKAHPQKNIITKALGLSSKSEAEISYEPISLKQGDILIQCTDGLTEYLSDSKLSEIASSNSPKEAAQKMIEKVLSGEARDNITVQIIKAVN